ncbi:hypothetical protein ABB37_02854 [Leptomonas pyrrhocoris]|uniref:PSP1 C-terminal domain-containing protein n=1 Tax=Leptomonas pyrrhocoris TaxID=157538 RepID=A0A0M9G6C0_LEPPY|nr:hypothetical protein ABB37_02854 [Leptomonas pyrrhocoris]KPA83159.1 hypothetical protein ABB37_02854 [Leptomonas pyrrhocoris]|eukprot:XP_015661598.1 hypothetical protein ABB37_02854 [Leptomonas pyrrhocoris]
MSNLRSNAASPTAEVNAAATPSAFRDVTNSYLNANKENIPPAGVSLGRFGGNGKGNERRCVAPAAGSTVGNVDLACCGTPVLADLKVEDPMNTDAPAVADCAAYESSNVVCDDPGNALPTAAPSRSPLKSLTRAITAGLTAVTPNTHKRADAAAACAATPSIISDSSLLSVARTPGHNVLPSANHTSGVNPVATTSTATKLMQQRSRSQCSPLYTQGKTGSAFSPTADVAAGVSGATQVSPQSSLHCTPSGARRSVAAAMAARALSETPTRMDDISFYLNNSFESGSETPTHDGAAGSYDPVRTPHRTFDLQQAVEEMLRGCFDTSTPARRSDSNGVSPHGSRKRQQHLLDTTTAAAAHGAPFNSYAVLESLFAAPAPSKTANTADVWGQGLAMTAESTPERFAAPHGVFAESDNDDNDGGTSPYSDLAPREVPAVGVRRDPMVYFSTSAVSSAADAYVESTSAQAPRLLASAMEEAMRPNSGGGGDDEGYHHPLPHCGNAPGRRSGGIEFHNDGLTNGTDMLAMLAAAVQQQSPRSAGDEYAEEESPTFSDRDGETVASAAAAGDVPPPPPSYDDVQQQSRYPRRNGATSAAPVGTSHVPQPTRRSHHLPQVKAAAGSLIAVSGRRVPVDKLHLLSLSSGDESATAPAIPSMAGAGGPRYASRGGGGAARSQVQSPPMQHHHVEGPSMRRVPKANVVTVTRAPASAGLGRSVNGTVLNGRGAGSPRCVSASASLPSSSLHTSIADVFAARTTATTRVVVPGPSARRIPPAGHPGASLQSRQNGAAAIIDGSGVRQSSETDVVAVLQFSKGQTMRFLANLSSSALVAAQAALTRDFEKSNGSSSSSSNGELDGAAMASTTLARAPLSLVEVGKSYLAHVYGDESPYENVPFEDVGVCVRLYPSSSSTPADQACREHMNGVLLREVDVFGCAVDRQQHEQALQQQTAAYIECERQFKFSSLPFQLESIYFTFDGSICVVFYRVVVADTAAAATTQRFTNTSRVVRELQFHLSCRVFLKQC